jgi:hypothetical protein
MTQSDNLWSDEQGDDLISRPPHRRQPRSAADARHIGCPLPWFRLVFPIVRGKNELAVALFIYRLRAIHRSRTIVVTNARLLADLGIDRYAKYRALRRLADARLITIRRHNKRALEITFLRQRRRKQ